MTTEQIISVFVGAIAVLLLGAIISAIFSAAVLHIAGRDRAKGQVPRARVQIISVLALSAIAGIVFGFWIAATSPNSAIADILWGPWR